MQKIIMIGNLTKDPEFKTTNSNSAYVNFTLAVQRPFANAQGERETDFINCVAWDKKAEFITKYATKGDKLSVVGHIRISTYNNREGNKITTFNVWVEEVEIVSSRKTEKKVEQARMIEIDDIDGESLPF
jgi:single-strand DNA-binding protein